VEVIMSTLHRAQLLLESEQHQALAEIAEQEGRSISDLVREIVRQHLAERRQQAQQLTALQAIERLTQIRARLQEEHGMYQGDPLAEVRAEWDEDVERTWQGDA
jgi:predicted DNA-binding ribbon-helix-helix protein